MHQIESKVIAALSKKSLDVKTLASEAGIPQDSVLRAIEWLKEKNAVHVNETEETELTASKEGKLFCEHGFPEERLLKKVCKTPVLISELSIEEKSVGLTWAKKLGWIAISGAPAKVEATAEGRKAAEAKYAMHEVLKKVCAGQSVGSEYDDMLRQLIRRGSVSEILRKHITVSLSDDGRKLAKNAPAEETGIGTLTRNEILSGAWKKNGLKSFNVEAPSEKAYSGKPHPLALLRERIRRVFEELGFTEMDGPEIDSAFWVFDSLFQPQDHPARELADTFYLQEPGTLALPDKDLVERVKNAHEKGWKYKWDEKIAKQAVLRTHTTSLSSRYLHATRTGTLTDPAKYFAIGRVYRNEATDFKHLAEFHQVEGIVVWENATFRNLLGILKEFYKKLGFKKIRFRPSFFPYTEPSLEIEAFFEEKGVWLELGGAGIFRPEVCHALWGKYPVLAWGLSLERPFMLKTGLGDIRTLYRNDVSWLRNSKTGDARWQQ